MPLPPGFAPRFRGDLGDLAGGHLRQAREHVAQVGLWVDAAAAAALDEGVEDGSAMAGLGLADEQPVLLPHGRGTDGVLDPVVVDGDAAVAQECFERRPLLERVADGFAQGALRQMPRTGPKSTTRRFI